MEELELIQRLSRSAGAFDAVICEHFSKGGLGAVQLGEAVIKASKLPSSFKFLYDIKVRELWSDNSLLSLNFG